MTGFFLSRHLEEFFYNEDPATGQRARPVCWNCLKSMDVFLRRKVLGVVWSSCALLCKLHAGGSGLNTVVVVNQDSSNSCILGNYYCERRQVPPQNVLRIHWPGGNTEWTSNDFQTNLVTPLLDMLAARQLTNQIEYVVLSMDIPFQTSFGSTVNSTT